MMINTHHGELNSARFTNPSDLSAVPLDESKESKKVKTPQPQDEDGSSTQDLSAGFCEVEDFKPIINNQFDGAHDCKGSHSKISPTGCPNFTEGDERSLSQAGPTKYYDSIHARLTREKFDMIKEHYRPKMFTRELLSSMGIDVSSSTKQDQAIQQRIIEEEGKRLKAEAELKEKEAEKKPKREEEQRIKAEAKLKEKEVEEKRNREEEQPRLKIGEEEKHKCEEKEKQGHENLHSEPKEKFDSQSDSTIPAILIEIEAAFKEKAKEKDNEQKGMDLIEEVNHPQQLAFQELSEVNLLQDVTPRQNPIALSPKIPVSEIRTPEILVHEIPGVNGLAQSAPSPFFPPVQNRPAIENPSVPWWIWATVGALIGLTITIATAGIGTIIGATIAGAIICAGVGKGIEKAIQYRSKKINDDELSRQPISPSLSQNAHASISTSLADHPLPSLSSPLSCPMRLSTQDNPLCLFGGDYKKRSLFKMGRHDNPSQALNEKKKNGIGVHVSQSIT